MTRLMILLTIVVLFLPACAHMPWQKDSNKPVAEMDSTAAAKDAQEPYVAPVVLPPGLALSPDQRFKDVPLPMGLKEDLDRTFVYESGNLQVGRMVYSSRASIFDLAQFFLTECPTAGWKRDNVLEAENSKTLVFSKPGKHMEVTVQALTIGKGRRVSIILTPSGEAGGGV